MSLGKSKKRFKIYSALTALFSLFMGVAVAASNINFKSNLLLGIADSQKYSITLDSSNKVTSSGDKDLYTKRGNKVTFTYSSVSGSTSGHVTLTNNGTITNKNWIRSITSVKADYTTDTSGAYLSFKSSYGGDVWSSAATMTSGQTYILGSDPYYLSFTSSGTVTVSSIYIEFSCQVNPDAHEGETSGGTATTSATLTGDQLQSAGVSTNNSSHSTGDYTVGGITYHVVDAYCYSYSSIYHLSFGKNNSDIGEIYNTTAFTGKITSLTVSYRTNSPEGDLYVSTNGSSWVAYSENTCSNGTYLYFKLSYVGQGSLSNYSNIASITINYEYDLPVSYGEPDPFVVGFSVTYNNNLNEDSIFDNDGNVVVRKQLSDGATPVLSSGYELMVYSSSGIEIDTSKAFGYDSRPGGNDYTLVVTYENFIPFESSFTVGQNIYVTDIESTFDVSGLSINTATTLNDIISHYSTTLSLRRGDPISGITYANFSNYSQYGLSLTLLDPSGVSHSFSTAFGTAGTWTLRTATTKNACVDESTFTVDAIPVTDITITGTLSVEEGKTTDLTLGVAPVNATNQLVDWTSSNTSVATVNSSGRVTGVSVGTATITATAKDGSGVFGSVTVTVTERTASPDYELLTDVSNLAAGQKVIIAGYNSSSSAYALSTTQNANNRASTAITISNDKITESTINNNSDIQIFTVKAGTVSNTFAFYDEAKDGYLYAANSSSNYLRTQTTNDANGSFSISVSSGDATILAQGSNTRNKLRFNYSNNPPIFSCYGSSATTGNAPRLYVNSGVKTYPTSITLSGDSSVAVGSTTTLTVNYTPENVNVKEVTWRSSDTSIATVSGGVVTGVAAGTATIYAKAATKTGYTAEVSKTIIVSNVAVTGVSLDKSSGTISVGKTVTLVPTISPSNATNKTVTWSTSNSSVATVSGGVVTGVSAGTATITVTTQDGNKTATYAVTVTTSGGGSGSGASEWTLVTDESSLSAGDVIVIGSYSSGAVAGNISSQILGSVTSGLTFSDSSTISELPDDALQLTLGGSEGAWTLANSDGQLLGATAVKKLAWDSGTTTWSISISGGSATIQNGTSSYGRFLYNVNNPRFTSYASDASSTMLLPEIYIGGSAEPTDPTGISLSPSSLELSAGQSSKLTATITPKGANQNKTITWSTSNSSVATVSNGTVTVSSSATVGQTATITAKLNDAPNKPQATATVTVVETSQDAWTILVYMCGADLESDSGFATGDIAEMLQLRNSQPDNMNIILETGGAKSWKNYNISASKLSRYALEPGKNSPTLIEQENDASMGNSSTLQNFIEWGVTNYPAQKTGLIFWNHGGALDGCCFDENHSDDPLTNAECLTAFKNAFKTLGRSEPLEWVGYDCCLMAVQDIAEFNSPYFNYMVSSQESESGNGWDYDNWIDNLYAGDSTENVLKAIVDSFIDEQGSSSDQTLSVLNLQNMAAYKTAWENMATAISSKYITSDTSWNTMKGYVNTAVKYGYISKYDTSANNNGYVYDIFNVSDVLSKFKTNYTNCSSEITAAQNALSNLITYNKCGTKAKTSCGVCCFFPISQYGTSSYYSTSITHFTTWRTLCFKYS